MKITVLGSGTSNGVPMIGCHCDICKSQNPKDKRLRSSVYIEHKGKKILIDISPDFRQQFLTNGLDDIDALLLTHSHYDHIAGMDDIRTINLFQKKAIPIYASSSSISTLKHTFPYMFTPPKQKGGGLPMINCIPINNKPFLIDDIEIIPLPIKHGILDIFGFRIENFAYITDASFISQDTINLLHNLDVLFLNALRPAPHSTHLNLESAVSYAEIIKAKQTYFTHISHGIMHNEVQNNLPPNVNLAYDGIIIEC
jgi:phosphoribosyl 1,2-cyclic phosphate phosphodiesterase